MKNRWLVALGFLVVALISCQCLRKQSATTASAPGSVQIDEHKILIPGTAISGEDREALNKIFRKYDSSLYRIGVYENGRSKEQLGTMSEMEMGEVTEHYAANAAASGMSNWTNRFGFYSHVTRHPHPPTSHVTHPGSPSHVTTGQPSHVTHPGRPSHVTHLTPEELDQESDALVKEVTPILEKYSK